MLHVEAKGFQPAELLIRIQASATATGDVKLARVVAPVAKLVDTETPKVRGAIKSDQMEQIPSDRGFLDLTRLEPGVQLLDGKILAASKVGLHSVLYRRPQWPHHPHAGWMGSTSLTKPWARPR